MASFCWCMPATPWTRTTSGTNGCSCSTWSAAPRAKSQATETDWPTRLEIAPSGRILVTGDNDGIVRVGPITGEEPHLLIGHEGMITSIAISPDGRWIASADDESVRLWPMPDATKPPLHTLPHDKLLAKLDTFTNLRAVRDEASPTGWSLEIGPFPGWETVPEW